jgi:hypothetical protein
VESRPSSSYPGTMSVDLFLLVLVAVCITAFGVYWILWRLDALSFTMKKECVRVIRGLGALRQWLVWSPALHAIFLNGIIATFYGLEFQNDGALTYGVSSLLLFATLFWVRWRSA